MAIARRTFFKSIMGGVLGIPLLRQVDNPQIILNLAATSELLAASFYLEGVKQVADLTPDESHLLKAIALNEWDHYQLFSSLGGQAAGEEFYVPNLSFDKRLFADEVEEVEADFVSGYLVAVRLMASIADEKLAVTMAQVAAVEAQHLALMRQMAGSLPNHHSFAHYVDTPIRESISGMDNFISGDEEKVLKIPYPTTEEMEAIREELTLLGYDSTAQAAIDR